MIRRDPAATPVEIHTHKNSEASHLTQLWDKSAPEESNYRVQLEFRVFDVVVLVDCVHKVMFQWPILYFAVAIAVY